MKLLHLIISDLSQDLVQAKSYIVSKKTSQNHPIEFLN